MKKLFFSIAVTLLAILMVTVPAGAKKKKVQSNSLSTSRLNAAMTECFKQNGAVYDPVKKKWTLYTSELHITSIGDALRQCISRRTGIPPGAVRIPEEPIYH